MPSSTRRAVRWASLTILVLPLSAFGPKGCGPFEPPCEALGFDACIADARCEPRLSQDALTRSDCAEPARCGFVDCRERRGCAPVTCRLDCAYGHLQDAAGCELCACNPAPAEECRTDADCPPDLRCLPDPADPCNGPTARCLKAGRTLCLPSKPTCNDMLCALYCPGGFQTGADGCPVCACKATACASDADCLAGERCRPDPTDVCNGGAVNCLQAGRSLCQPATSPCPEVMCEMWCPGGFQRDASGCEVCRCNPSDAECLSDADCGDGERCQPDPGRGRSVCAPAATRCSGLDEPRCSANPGCRAVYVPLKCPGQFCAAVLVYDHCE